LKNVDLQKSLEEARIECERYIKEIEVQSESLREYNLSKDQLQREIDALKESDMKLNEEVLNDQNLLKKSPTAYK
jgi:cell division septum initiation protein DivIVA